MERRNIGIREGLLLYLPGGDAVKEYVTDRLGQAPNEGLGEPQVTQRPVRGA